jgi:hypothetical protein
MQMHNAAIRRFTDDLLLVQTDVEMTEIALTSLESLQLAAQFEARVPHCRY